jgi:hypothetical protein
MTDDELRDELESLKARVSRLERLVEQDDGNPTPDDESARAAVLDHYDRPVVDSLSEDGVYHVRDLVKRYKRQSRITDHGTAKERVQRLVRTDGFTAEAGGDHRFTGWE